MPLRAEFIVASLLAEATVPFRFNAGAGPDLLVGGDPPAFGIEIGLPQPEQPVAPEPGVEHRAARARPSGRGGDSHRPDSAGRDPRKRSAVDH
jgi:hypothetical protein